MSRKNGELESTVRKLRGDLRGLEGERERERNRVKALEAEAATAQARAASQMQALENDCAALEAELEAVRLEAQEQVPYCLTRRKKVGWRGNVLGCPGAGAVLPYLRRTALLAGRTWGGRGSALLEVQ